MPRKEIDYSKCIIYKIVCNDFNIKDLYVGHTTDLIKRRSVHKYTCNNDNLKHHNLKIYKVIRENGGWENWSVIVIENFNTCKDSEDARMRERYWFENLSANMNTVRPQISDDELKQSAREYSQASYINNKEEKLNKSKQYYYDNKEKVSLYQKEYYNKKKEEISDYTKEYMKKYRLENKDKLKQYRESIKDRMKQYYIDNKAKILERQKERKHNIEILPTI